jgi:hypothetical protein
VLQDRLDEEGVALGLAVDRHRDLGGARAELLAPGPRLEELEHLLRREPAQHDALEARVTAQACERLCQRVPPVEVDVPVRAEDQEAAPREPPREVLEHQQRRAVRPVEIVEDEDHGRPP